MTRFMRVINVFTALVKKQVVNGPDKPGHAEKV